MFNLTNNKLYNNCTTLQIGLKYCPPNPMLSFNFKTRAGISRFLQLIEIKHHWMQYEAENPRYVKPFYSKLIKLAPGTWLPNTTPRQMRSILLKLRKRLKSAIELQKKPTRSLPRRKDGYEINLHDILKNPSIKIIQSDKNMGLCIIPTEMYIRMTRLALSDRLKYRILPNYRRRRIEFDNEQMKMLAITLLQSSRFKNWNQALNYVRQSDDKAISSFYILPKMHKQRLPNGDPATRPIVANKRNNIFYRTSKVIAIWLNGIISKIRNSPILTNSLQLINHFKQQEILSVERDILFTFDIDNMYGEIDLNNLYSILYRNLGLNQKDMQLLRIALGNNIFKWYDNHYEQIKGIAMGAPASAPAANLYMFFKLDKPLCNIFPRDKLIYYTRYIDDSHGLFRGSENEYSIFIDTVKILIAPLTLKEKHSFKEVDFLDLTIFKPQQHSTLHTKVYQKEGNNYQYLPYPSSHPISMKQGFILGELIRYKRICTKQNDFDSIKAQLWNRLRNRGYPVNFLIPLFRRNLVISNNREQQNTPSTLILSYSRHPINSVVRDIMVSAEKELLHYIPELKLVLSFKLARSLGSKLIQADLRGDQIEYARALETENQV